MEEIAADRSYVWHSNRERLDAAAVEGARAASLPATVTPEVAHVARAVPDGDEWLHEIEIEGERIICRGEKGRMRLLDTAGDDWTKRAPAIAGAANLLPATSLIVDGMLAALMPDGTTRRAALDEALRGKGPAKLTYFAFDLLFFDGHDLSGVPLEKRKELLKALLARVAEPGPLRFADHVAGNGAAFFQGACRLGAPGVVSKRRDSRRSRCARRRRRRRASAAKRRRRPRTRPWRVVRCAPRALTMSRPPRAELGRLRALHPRRLPVRRDHARGRVDLRRVLRADEQRVADDDRRDSAPPKLPTSPVS